ncbi:vWA domain-containing protein [Rummeliibacillus stabekisii]|uniref:hypothetical protein n=1 Tax=Rummeliibacillus stabekisii TaxID=241244 RepID=UPI0037161170
MFTKEERIKQREGDRLYRSLRRSFKKMKFGFNWTNEQTSYFDGKDIYVKYDMQTDKHREFSQEELRGLRIGHGFHEAGHAEFDYLPDYISWGKQLTSGKREDWEANIKYPSEYVEFFGNMSLDGRMERLVKIACPSQIPFIDLSNYEWRFKNRLEGIGEELERDFTHCFSHRVLGMDDNLPWLQEAIDLLDSVSKDIELIRTAPTTAGCLELVTELIRKVWPTLWQWIVENETEKDIDADDEFNPSESKSNWAESKEAASNASKHVNARSTGPNASDKQNFDNAMKRLAKQFKQDQSDTVKEEKEFENSKVKVSLKGVSNDIIDTVNVSFYDEPDLSNYNQDYASIKRHIQPIARELEAILAGSPSESRKNVRSGRLMPHQVWRATHCDDNNIFENNKSGTPSADAFLAFMTDISGSTWCRTENGTRIIDEMRKSLVLMLEAAEIARIPSLAYAFTEEECTEIYRLKSNPDTLTSIHKGAIGGISPKSGNRDTLALKYLLDQIKLRDEKIRLAIMLSDGIPCFEAGEGKETIAKMVKDASKEGIEVLCLFIGDHDRETLSFVKEMYPRRVINAKAGVAKELQKQIKRIIRQSRG